MAVTQIGGTFVPVSEILQRPFNADLLFNSPQPVLTTDAQNLPRREAILIQAQTVINDTLQNLTSPQQAALRLNSVLDNLSFSQQVKVLSQSKILLDTALENLGASPEASLLINAKALVDATLARINAVQEADLLRQIEISINEALRNLSPSQQAEILVQTEVLINEGIQRVSNLPGPETFDQPALLGLPETTLFGAGVFTAPQDFTPSLFETEQVRLSSNETILATEAQTQNLVEPAISTAQPVTTTAPALSEVSQLPAAETLPTAPPLPIRPLEAVDPTPYAIAVYEVNSQKTAPLEPEPETKPVEPTPPVEKAGLLNLFFHWTSGVKEKEADSPIYIPYNKLTEEEVLRKIIHHFNESQVNKNLPTRLALASTAEGLALDVYDCSDNIVCRLAYNAPLGSSSLTQIMDHLRKDDGVFINTRT